MNEKLYACFEIKRLGKLKYFLGMKTSYSKYVIFLSLLKYILELKETRTSGGKLTITPIDPYKKLGWCEDIQLIDRGRYYRLFGTLIYLLHTRLDITYTVGLLSQFMHDPREEHNVEAR